MDIGKHCEIAPSVSLDDVDDLVIGDYTKIRDGVILDGNKIHFGRACLVARGVTIGGGRAELGSFECGDFAYIGDNSMVNIADSIVLGDEVIMGMYTMLYTHSLGLSQFEGFPNSVGSITIGNHVWLPDGTTVLPNVKIGDNVVVSAKSVVGKDLPSGCLAAGNPARVILANEYPKPYTSAKLLEITHEIEQDAKKYGIETDSFVIDIPKFKDNKLICVCRMNVGYTEFDLINRRISGLCTTKTELFREILRRHGVRFKYGHEKGVYVSW